MSPVTSNCGVPLYNHIIYLSLAEASQAIERRMPSSDIRSIMASNRSRSQDITTCGLRSNYVDEQVKLSVKSNPSLNRVFNLIEVSTFRISIFIGH